MNAQPQNTGSGRRARFARGLSLIEVVISLAIVAMLLTAVAAAFTASASAIDANDQFFSASQAARVSLNQILAQIRTAHAVSVSSGKVDMITHDGHDCSYVYDSTAKLLKLVTNDITTDPDYKLASNVTSMTCTADSVTDAGGISHVVRVSVSLVVEVGKNQMRLSGAAAPRRVQTYN